MSGFEYNKIPKKKIKDVEVLPQDSEEWKKYRRNLINNKTGAKEEREEKIKSNPEKFEKFQNEAKKLLQYPPQEKRELRKRIIELIKKMKTYKFGKIHNTDYGKKIEIVPHFKIFVPINKLDWWEFHHDKVENRNGKYIYMEDLGKKWKLKKVLKEEKIKYGQKNIGWKYKEEKPKIDKVIPKSYRNNIDKLKKVLEELRKPAPDRERKEILRYCFNKHLNDIENTRSQSRIEAYLRDLNSDISSKHKSNLGKGGRKFEKKVKKKLKEWELELQNNIFKIKLNSGNIRYKEADAIIKTGDIPHILEIFTQRNAKQKKKQVENYRLFYEIAKINCSKPQTLLVTKDKRRGTTLEELKDLFGGEKL